MIERVEVERVFNLGNYENIKIRLVVDAGPKPEKAFATACNLIYKMYEAHEVVRKVNRLIASLETHLKSVRSRITSKQETIHDLAIRKMDECELRGLDEEERALRLKQLDKQIKRLKEEIEKLKKEEAETKELLENTKKLRSKIKELFSEGKLDEILKLEIPNINIDIDNW